VDAKNRLELFQTSLDGGFLDGSSRIVDENGKRPDTALGFVGQPAGGVELANVMGYPVGCVTKSMSRLLKNVRSSSHQNDSSSRLHETLRNAEAQAGTAPGYQSCFAL